MTCDKVDPGVDPANAAFSWREQPVWYDKS